MAHITRMFLGFAPRLVTSSSTCMIVAPVKKLQCANFQSDQCTPNCTTTTTK